MPTPYTGNTRDLPYLLSKSLVPNADTPQTPTILNHPFSWSTSDPDERVNILLNLSLNEYIALSSCIDVGSDIAYGEDAIVMWWIWVRSVLSTNPQGQLSETGDCYTYPLYAPFIDYFPYNPFNEPDTIPSGYLFPPFHFGGIGYEDTDLLVDLAAFPIFANWFDIINGFLPQIAIKTIGDGQIELDLLSIINGGYLVIKPNSPPNILDIFLGIFDPSIRIIDTNTDVAFPSELDIVIAEEFDVVVGTGVEHTLYITWIPALDDSSIPLRFGGGIRSVQLCGFESAGVIMGITDIRINNCEIEKFENGVWSNISGSLQTCINNALIPLSEDILDLQQNDIVLQSQINSNDADITALQQNDIVLQSQINSNDADITALQNTATSLQNQINSNDTDITALQNALTTTQNQVNVIQGDLNTLANITIPLINGDIATLQGIVTDHESRIDALEVGIPIGSASIKATPVSQYFQTEVTNANTTYSIVGESQYSHHFTYDNALIIAEFRAKSVGTLGISYFRLGIQGYGSSPQEVKVKTNIEKSVQAQGVWANMQGVTATISVEFKAGTQDAVMIGDQNIQYTILEWAGAAANTVTFDNGGKAYSLASINTGVISTGGNPDKCLLGQNVSGFGDALGIDVDFGQTVQFNSILLDVYSSNFANTIVTVVVNGVQIQQVGLSGSPNQWLQFALNAGSFPVSHSSISVYVSVATGQTVADLRMDNVVINYQ